MRNLFLGDKFSKMNYMKKIYYFLGFLFTFLAIAFLFFSAGNSAASSAKVGVSGEYFTINGEERFLLGVSLFDAINLSSSNLESDLDYLEENGYNLIRVWADWSWQNHKWGRDSTVYTKSGGLNNTISQLKKVIEESAKRGIVVDLAIQDTNPYFYSDGEDFSKRLKAAREITRALKDYDNLFFDLCNEYDHGGDDFYPMSVSEARQIAQAVKLEDSDRLITISSTGKHLVDKNGNLNGSNLAAQINTIGVDIVSPHFYRDNSWWSAVGERTAKVKSGSRGKPVYIQEENYYPGDSSASHFVESAKRAKNAEAAGWIFHQTAGLSYDTNKPLKNYSFYNALESGGRAILEQIGSVINTSGGGSGFEIFDALNGNSKGKITGGELTSSGWKTSDGSSRIEYNLLGNPTNGGVEFDVKGMGNSVWQGKGGNDIYNLFSIYDNSPELSSGGSGEETKDICSSGHGDARNIYYAAFWFFDDDYEHARYKNRFRGRANANNRFVSPPPMKADNTPRAFEQDSQQFDIEPNKSYRLRCEWGAGRMTFSVNGDVIGNGFDYASANQSYFYGEPKFEPAEPVLRVGQTHFSSAIGATFSNLRASVGGVSINEFGGGWTPTRSDDDKEFSLGSGDTSSGFYEVTISNIQSDNWNAAGESLYGLIALYDRKQYCWQMTIPGDCDYYSDNADNHYHFSLWAYGPDKRPERYGKLRPRVNIGNEECSDQVPESFESDTKSFNWNPGKTYHFKATWDENGIGYFLDGEAIETYDWASLGDSFNPINPVLRIGGMHYDSAPNLLYSNVHVWLGDGGDPYDPPEEKRYELKENASRGARYFLDRDYILEQLPSEIEGLTLLKTRNNDKMSAGDSFINLNINKETRVYLSWDRRFPLPSWASGFTPTSFNIETSDPGTNYKIYVKEFPNGEVVLGGNQCPHNSCSMYFAFLDYEGELFEREDINKDGLIDVSDIGIIMSYWGENESLPDLDKNGVVGVSDILGIIEKWTF